MPRRPSSRFVMTIPCCVLPAGVMGLLPVLLVALALLLGGCVTGEFKSGDGYEGRMRDTQMERAQFEQDAREWNQENRLRRLERSR